MTMMDLNLYARLRARYQPTWWNTWRDAWAMYHHEKPIFAFNNQRAVIGKSHPTPVHVPYALKSTPARKYWQFCMHIELDHRFTPAKSIAKFVKIIGGVWGTSPPIDFTSKFP
jgi:hypothetical protein